MDALASDRFCPNEHGLFRWIFDELINRGDRYFHLADFPSYVETQARDRRRISGRRRVVAQGDPERRAHRQVLQRPHGAGVRARHLAHRAVREARAGRQRSRSRTAALPKKGGEPASAAEAAPEPEEKQVAD